MTVAFCEKCEEFVEDETIKDNTLNYLHKKCNGVILWLSGDQVQEEFAEKNQRIAELETIDIKVINKVILEIGVYLMRDCIDDDGYENLAEALLPNWHDTLVQATYKYQDEALQPKDES